MDSVLTPFLLSVLSEFVRDVCLEKILSAVNGLCGLFGLVILYMLTNCGRIAKKVIDNLGLVAESDFFVGEIYMETGRKGGMSLEEFFKSQKYFKFRLD